MRGRYAGRHREKQGKKGEVFREERDEQSFRPVDPNQVF
jgi:hypothetical protein